jgi:hypothetical protein
MPRCGSEGGGKTAGAAERVVTERADGRGAKERVLEAEIIIGVDCDVVDGLTTSGTFT